MVEKALLIVLIAFAIVSGVRVLADEVNLVFCHASAALTTGPTARVCLLKEADPMR